MTVYLVAYDLLKEKSAHDYEPLWAELKRLGAQKTQLSVWLVAVNNTAKELVTHLKAYVDSDDRLWAAELVQNHGFVNAMGGTNAWLKSNPPAR